MLADKRTLFTNKISKYFNKKGYVVEEGGLLDLIIKKNSLTIPVEVKCRKKGVKNNNMFTVSFTMNQLMQLKKTKRYFIACR